MIYTCYINKHGQRFTLRWLNPLLKLGTKKELQIEDLYKVLPEDETEKLGLKLQKYYAREFIFI